MNIEEAIDGVETAVHQTVRRNGGAAELAPRMGLSAGVLANKVNPACPSNHLTAVEALRLQHITGDLSILTAEAAALGCSVVQFVDMTGCSDVELLDAYSEWHARVGGMASAVSQSFADRRITRDECHQVRSAFFIAAAAAMEFIGRLYAVAEPGEEVCDAAA